MLWWSQSCPRTFHVESAAELSRLDLDGCKVIGLTAGASTPEDQIADARSILEAL